MRDPGRQLAFQAWGRVVVTQGLRLKHTGWHLIFLFPTVQNVNEQTWAGLELLAVCGHYEELGYTYLCVCAVV